MVTSKFSKKMYGDGSSAESDNELDALRRELEALQRAISKKNAASKEMSALAGNTAVRADSASDNYTEKSNTAFGDMKKYGEEQKARYEELIDMIKSGDYKSNPAAKSIIDSYMSAAESAFDDALATGGAENGGNIDSYSAANANRQKLAVTSLGEQTALDYFDDMTDKLLKVITSLGSDSDDLFGRIQDNIDTDADVSEGLYSIAGDLYSDLSDRELEELEISSAELEKLFDAYTNVYKPSGSSSSVSPMELEREYTTLVPEGAAESDKLDALIKLWKKYPDMHDTIINMYEKMKEEKDIYKFTDLE